MTLVVDGDSAWGDRRNKLLQDPLSIEKVLRAMGLSCDAQELAPTRAPPGGEQGWLSA